MHPNTTLRLPCSSCGKAFTRGFHGALCVGCWNRSRALEPAERFWRQVDRRGAAECWPWKGGRDDEGYGRFRTGGKDSPRILAHRFAYELAVGFIPPELEVRHTCDNPPCCNPAHLLLGVHLANIRDKVRRGRQARGAGHGMAKLSVRQMQRICERYAAGETQVALARAYRVTQANISSIVLGKSWGHVPRQLAEPRDRRALVKLSAADVEAILARRRAGERLVRIAADYGIHFSRVAQLAKQAATPDTHSGARAAD